MSAESDKWKKRYERERSARKEAEQLLEAKALTLYDKNRQLEELSAKLSKTVERRTEELKYSTSKLREEEQRLANLAQTFPGVIFQWFERANGESGFYYVSPGIEKIFGCSPSAVIKDWRSLQIHREDLGRWRDSLRESVADFTNWRFTGRLTTPSGEVKWFQGDSKPLRISPNEVVFNGVFLDITQQKNAEVEIRRLSMVASRTTNGVIITDECGRVVWINEGFERISGYQMKDMLGRSPGAVLQGPQTDPQTTRYIREQLRAKKPFTAEILNYRKNGETYWLRVDINPLFDDRGELTNYIGIETDITRQKETETALKLATEHAREAAREANRANEAKSRFLANMSHEIRTPLNGVLGFTQVLEMRNDLPRDAAEMIRSIGRSGEHLLHLINDILDISKIEAGKYQLTDADILLQEMLRDIEEVFAPNAQLKSLKYEVTGWDFAEDKPLDEKSFYFRSDARALRQVLLNLVGNAIKFTTEGSVLVKGGPNGPTSLKFLVEDSGVGIPESDQSRIFETFEQSSHQSPNAGGTGLGLPICRKLVSLMEGSLYLESTPGMGARFWFEIPLLPPTETHAVFVPVQAPHSVTYSGPRKSILVVDDDENSRRVVKELLLKAGFLVRSVSSAQDGLREVERTRPDLIATDLLMPEMDGFEFCRRIRTAPATRHVPVIAVSASVMRTPENEIRLKPFSDFISKPVKASEIYEKVGKALNLKMEELEADRETADHDREELPMVAPPTPELEKILALVLQGDMLGVQNHFASTAQLKEAYPEFFAKANELAVNFQAQALEDLLTSCMESQPSE